MAIVLFMVVLMAIALPAAAGFVPDVRSLSVDSGVIKIVTPLEGSVLRAQQMSDPTGAAGISRQENTGEETSVPMNYNPYDPYTAIPARIPNWWGGRGWGGFGWGGWGWPMWNNWGGWW